MRYLPVTDLKNGLALGQDIYDGEGQMLLAKHQILNDYHIAELGKRGFHGVYVDDDFSEDIEVEQLIKPEIRRKALQTIHTLFVEDGEADLQELKIRKLVIDVVEDVLSNGDIMYNMMEVKSYDDYIFYHSVNVAVLSTVIGARYGLDKYELRTLTAAALLHDIGKKFLDEDVLEAKRPLEEEEKHHVLQHTTLGYDYLRANYDFAPEVCAAVLEHHEYYNGEGYPRRRSGSEISLYARIIKLADVYDAMTSVRPYRDVLSPSDAVEYIMAMCGSEFDPELVEIFLKWVAVYPVGCEVELSDKRHAIVAKNFANFILRPVVKIMDTGEQINLNTDRNARNITIIRLVV